MLKSNWGANGVGYILPGKMKILTKKVTNQVSSLFTYTPMPGGANWMLDYALNVECQERTEDFGIAI